MTNNKNAKEIIEILGNVELLEGLELEALEDIATSVDTTSFSAGETIIARGETSERLYIISDGELQILIPDIMRGVDRKVNLQRGSIVGEISLLAKQPYSADVVAHEDSSVLFLDRENFDRLIETHKSFARVMSNLVGERLTLDGGINQVGKYKLLNKLGEGNMAIVFNAYDPDLERDVAIKMLKYELSHDPEFLTRFRHEAKIIASLNHPNIVDVYENLEELSTGFMVMEKLSGLNLAQILKQKVSLDVTQARRILHQIASALHYAHTNRGDGIVHRDIKPSNIIVNEFNHVTITDFGIARPPDSESDNIEGSPHYLAPEVIQSKPVDGRADIYAMGILAFHILTGSPPFSAKSMEKIFDMHVNQAPPDIRKFRPEIDENLAQFIDRALVKNPEARINDWTEIKRLLKPVSSNPPMPVSDNEIVFMTRLQHSSLQDAAKVINSLKAILEDAGIEYKIALEREETVEETMSIVALKPEDFENR